MGSAGIAHEKSKMSECVVDNGGGCGERKK